MANGRFAPSPTGPLHLGNLRTAIAAWLFARSSGGRFVVRMEDLDRVTSSREHAASQLRDLELLGLDWDGEVVFQSDRFEHYDAAVQRLTDAGLTYPCFCSRREIRDAAAAPHGDADHNRYPGTCRMLGAAQHHERQAAGRAPALRLRTLGEEVVFVDAVGGKQVGLVDDVVLRRNDGVPAYNLAVVVDDEAQGIQQVVRGDDLLASTPSQVHLARLLGLPDKTYAHVPLVLGADGTRLAKRDGAVTLGERLALGESPGQVRSYLLRSLGLDPDGSSLAELAERFTAATIDRTPFVFTSVPRSPRSR